MFPKTWSESEVAQSCPTLCSPMDCSLPGSSIHGIFQARVLQLVAISFSRRSSRPRDWTPVSRIVGRRLPSEPPGKFKEQQKVMFPRMKKSCISTEEKIDALRQSSKGKISLAPSDDIKEPRLCSWHQRPHHFYVEGGPVNKATLLHTFTKSL